jgi:hypothetical protein
MFPSMSARSDHTTERIAADINIDGINIWGRTRDLTMTDGSKKTDDTDVPSLIGIIRPAS